MVSFLCEDGALLSFTVGEQSAAGRGTSGTNAVIGATPKLMELLRLFQGRGEWTAYVSALLIPIP